MIDNNKIEVWGYKSFRPFRIYWALYEYNLKFVSYKIGSRTGETQTKEYLKINSKGKIPSFKHDNITITESAAAVSYIVNNFKKPKDFFIPNTIEDKAKLDEWCFFSLMELDCLSIYILRRHEKPENLGLSEIYGEADNAIETARSHFDRMISACEKNINDDRWLLGNSPSMADIIFMSCLIHCDNFNLEIKSDKVNSYIERVKNRKQFQLAFQDCFNL
ncbi:glutathione S-transferase family protein [Alphaproteobacteria bacterium]|nr:glutathione S-transferase family protein [Alphaproteobacteria bacterium]